MNEYVAKKAVLKEKSLIRTSDGKPEKFNNYFKTNLLFDNGDYGVCFTKEMDIPQEIGKEYDYKIKEGVNQKGKYYTISFNMDSQSDSKKWEKKFGNTNLKIAEIAVQLAIHPEAMERLNATYDVIKKLVNVSDSVSSGTNDPRTEPDDAIIKHLNNLFDNYRKAILPAEDTKYKQEIVKTLMLYKFTEESINKLK